MNGITTIQIGGQPVTLRFAYEAYKRFQLALSSDTKGLFWTSTDVKKQSLTDYAYAKIFFFAYENDCLVKEIEPVLKFVNFYDWVADRLASEELAVVVKVWATTLNSAIPEDKKKEIESLLSQTEESTSTQSNEPVTV